MNDDDLPADPAAWRRLGLAAGTSGLAAVVLIFAVLIGSRAEPAYGDDVDAFLTHYRASNTVASPLRSFFLTVGVLLLAWFVVTLCLLLRRVEGEAPWRSTVAMATGLVFVVLVLSGSEVAAVLTAEDLDPQVARYAFDESQAAFANGRVALGSFALCCGWVIVSTRFLPRWLGWLAVVSGVGLVLSRLVWTNPVWLLPYLMFWAWTVSVAVLLLRRNLRRPAPSA